MRRIRITNPIPPSALRESESARFALVGLEIDVDTKAVQELRESHRAISPKQLDTYEATLDEVLLALHHLGRIEAATDWSIIRPHLIRIPFSCAKRVLATEVAT